jgi:alkaline phosphatase D
LTALSTTPLLASCASAEASMAAKAGGPAVILDSHRADVPRFGIGVASGQSRPTSLVLWTRLTGAGLPARVNVRYELAHDEAFTKNVRRGTFEAEASWAHSVHAELEGLEPGRWYFYRFLALGQRSMTGRTRTAPAQSQANTGLRMAIASCQRYDNAHYAAWRHLSQSSLDAVVFLGDYIYESGSPKDALRPHRGSTTKTLEAYRDRYAQYKSDPWLQAAHAACPWWTVWDDHEVDNDYARDQDQNLEPNFMARRAAAYQAYWEHMPFSMAQRPRGPDMRIVDRFQWGALATLHLLDDRQYRDHQACPYDNRAGSATVKQSACPALNDPKRSLLGAQQEAWLHQGWDLQRPWNLVGQQTLMAPFGMGDDRTDPFRWTDGWDGYPHARQRLLQSLHDRQVRGAVILGGDVHTHYVTSLHLNPEDVRSPLVASEFCGASITSRAWPDSRVKAGMANNPHVHYGRSDKRGAIVFDVNAKQLTAQLLGVDDPLRADSPVQILTTYVVEAGQPGPKPA